MSWVESDLGKSNYQQMKFVLLLLLMASLPFAIKLANALILVTAIISSLSFLNKKPKRKPDNLTLLVVLFLILEALSLIYTNSENIKIGLSVLETHIPFLLIPIIFWDMDLSSNGINYLKMAFVGGCFIASLICVGANVQLSLIEGKILHEYYFSHDMFSYPIGMQAVYFSMYLSLCVLSILNSIKEKFVSLTYSIKIFLVLLVVYFLVLIVALGARTTIVMLMFIIMLNIITISWRSRAWKFLVVTALIPIIFVGLVSLNPVATTRFLDLRHNQTEGSNYDSYFARTNIWNPGVEAITENLWFGVGVGDQETELFDKFRKYNYLAGVELKFNFHNQYLQTALGVGIIGLILFLAILIIQFLVSIKHHDFLYTSFLLLFSGACLTESMLNRNKGIVFFIIFSFIFYKSRSASKN